jgi:RNA polymerase sigma-70 factor (ECF subfamily)
VSRRAKILPRDAAGKISTDIVANDDATMLATPPIAGTVTVHFGSIMSMPSAKTSPADVALDAESRRWLVRLRSDGSERDDAIRELHQLLVRAARFEINRRRAAMPFLRGDDYDDLAHQSASDALVAILAKLDDYRGASRFTTWVYKFALLEAAVKLRRRSWQGREIPHDTESWAPISDSRATPDRDAASAEVMRAIRAAIDGELTAHQRATLVAVAVDGVPIDVLAERRNTTRGALYKTLHDARRKLRAALDRHALGPDALEKTS